jgi:hypothetical protein
MRATSLGIFIVAALGVGSGTAYAQDPAAGTGTTGATGPATDSGQAAGKPTAEAPTDVLPPPSPNMTSGSGAATATPVAAAAVATSPNDWKFSWNGYLRAPLRIGEGHRRPCNLATATTPAEVPMQLSPYSQATCAAPGQSTNVFHTPYIPDDQYLSWTFDRQWEQAWAEIFLSYGNKWVVGTVSVQGYDFTDASLLGNAADPAQFGIAQAWVSLTPDLPVDGLRLNWKVGAFWEKFGGAGKYDGGHYDTYMFGRTHQIGESLSVQYDVGDFTLKAEHGFGAHLEMVPAGIPVNGSSSAQAAISNTAGTLPPLGGSPGFTLVDHAHVGVSWKKIIDVNAHYLMAWSQDDREQVTGTNPSAPDGSLAVYGAEARVLGGVFGEFYGAYSHIDATNVTQVGPGIEVMHSSGGGGHNAGNGIYENFFNGLGQGTGQIDNVQIGYDFSFGYLWRKLQNPNAHFWGDGADVRLSLFGMYSAISGMPAADNTVSINAFSLQPSNGSKKLKYGADLVASVLPWMGFGVRADYVQPDSTDTSESFGVISPRIMIHSKFITHEEITMQYSHYWDGQDVLAQQYLALVGTKNINAKFAVPAYPNDPDVFGIKGTMWW